jgi:hypothetical protein
MCVQGDLEAVIYGQARRSSRSRSSARETFEEALKSRGTVAEARRRVEGLPRGVLDEVMGS